MTTTPRSNRYHIAVFGRRNAGKSSLVNCIAGQAVSIVSDVPGTTTDAVWKNIELPGIGAAVIADTAGFDDEGGLGTMRVDAARKVLVLADAAILLLGDDPHDASLENGWIKRIKTLGVPLLLLMGKCDTVGSDARLKEYIRDYASPATRAKGEAMIRRLLDDVPNERARAKATEYLDRIANGERDFRF